ncbi:GFA family protein [Alteromonas sp. H39]|uniref:GFA family protein n=1 Tax=Alteromonas sp. H39 TaxID=3389876 RepID=UPI0039E055AF
MADTISSKKYQSLAILVMLRFLEFSMSYLAQCLCQSVALRVKQLTPEVSACHCRTCRQWGGGPLLTLHCGGDVILSGDAITRYASSEWAERGFCRECGTHLFYFYKKRPAYFIPAALFGDDIPFTLTEQIFIDQKPDYYGFSQCTATMTADEAIAAFTAQE